MVHAASVPNLSTVPVKPVATKYRAEPESDVQYMSDVEYRSENDY